MRAYSEQHEENFRARKLLREWRDEKLLSQEQYEQLESETRSEFQTTNLFLRIVLLLFTLVAVSTAVGLFFVVMNIRSSGLATGMCFLVFAGLSYFAAETAVSQMHQYRHGIEEALAIASVIYLCLGVGALFVSGYSRHAEHEALLLVSLTGTLSSLWIWYRFGLPYAFPAAMIFTAVGAAELLTSYAAKRSLLCILYAVGFASVVAVGSRHRFDYLRQRYSLAKALLWFGIYLTLNLKLSGVASMAQLWAPSLRSPEFGTFFYWMTWVLLWCLPPLIVTRAVREKDRFVLATGILTAVLTLITNKPYLGWQRHTWDPMLLGVALVGVAVFLQRWLGRGTSGVRHGFTAEGMSARHKRSFSVASSVMGFVAPHALTPTPQPQAQAQHSEFDSGFGGGSGGGGASGDF